MKSALIAGSGGQGVLFLGKLLAQSAMLSGKYVTWFPSYGAEMRGGTANCTVIVSDEMIGSPIVGRPDLLVVLNEASKARFEGRLKEGGLLVMDSSVIGNKDAREGLRVLAVPATEIAASMGSPKSANMVMFGALICREGLVDEGLAMLALEQLTPSRRKSGLEINKEAIRKGRAFCED